ncbi:MAG: glycosyltransferase [Gemmatimonadales bacterium]
MRSQVPPVSVIIPTTALPERADLLRAAVQSVLDQEGVHPVPILVVNGPGADATLRRELAADARLRVLERAEASLPGALAAGRAAVDTPWFAALDDDDLLLPGALRVRVNTLLARPECHVVVTNGFERRRSGDRLHVPDPAPVRRDPLRAVVRYNWLLPGSWLGRRDAIGPDLFAGMPKFLECTYLAIQFSTAFRMVFLETPTVVWRVNTPRSVSHSTEYLLGQDQALRELLRLKLPADVRAVFERRLGTALHSRAVWHARAGQWRNAWRWHLRSLAAPAGWRFLSFTFRLVAGLR